MLPERSDSNVKLASACDRHSDAQLVTACKRGEVKAFELLVKKHDRQVEKLLRRLAPDWSDLADVKQDVFIHVWRFIRQLRDPYAFHSWLHHIVLNIFYDESRKRYRYKPAFSIDQPVGEDGTLPEIPDNSRLPEEISWRKELSHCLSEAIEQLPDVFRSTLVLRELDGLSYEQISVITHSPKGTVKSRINRARQRMRGLLTHNDKELEANMVAPL